MTCSHDEISNVSDTLITIPTNNNGRIIDQSRKVGKDIKQNKSIVPESSSSVIQS